MKTIFAERLKSCFERFRTIRIRSVRPVVVMLMMTAAAGMDVSRATTKSGEDAPTSLSAAERQIAVASVTSGYNPWTTVLLNGKLHADGLPLSPSMKIFMERERRIMISIRAPFVGEVGRVEIDRDSVMMVNKMKKIYVKEPLDALPANLPVSIADLQCIFLGRIAIGGSGELDSSNASMAEFYPDAGGGWLVAPVKEARPYGADYGYLTMPDGRLQAFMATAGDGNDVATIIYGYSGLSTELMMSLRTGNKEKGVEMELEAPKWGAQAFEPLTVTSKYRRTDFSGFFKSF